MRRLLCGVLVVVMSLVFAPVAMAGVFGLQSLEVSATEAPPAGHALNALGPVDVQAGSHPYVLTTSFLLSKPEEIEVEGKSIQEFRPSGGGVKDTRFELPAGFMGNPDATPRCAYQRFANKECPNDTAVGEETVVRNDDIGYENEKGEFVVETLSVTDPVAVLSVVHRRLVVGGEESLTGLLGELMSAIVLPYLGGSAAQKELHKPAPSLKKRKTPSQGDPLEGLDMRITYRTVRALIAIGSQPGASNREIATAAGIGDQGQISKLLTRLEHLGLIHNEGFGHAKGAPNAWALTERGLEVERAISVQSASRPELGLSAAR